MNLEDIKSVEVEWSESNLINEELGCDDKCEINKTISPTVADDLIKRAAKEVGGGYDKTMMAIRFKDGTDWGKCKFYITSETQSLAHLIS